MITIQEAVDKILKSRPYLEEALNDGLINLTSLARQMVVEIEDVLS